MRASILLAGLISAAAGCGGGSDPRLDENRRRCEALASGTPFSEVAQQLRTAPSFGQDCRNDWAPVADDTCPYGPTQEICISAFQWYTADSRACTGPFQNGVCAYRCEVRTAGRPVAETPVCARQFFTGQ